ALGSPGGMRWLDCEVVKNADGAPRFEADGSVAARIAELGIGTVHLTISHDGGFATAMVVCEA
ncbi:MAG TPA: holo-ACP synthase, partial [Arachnia sp.]|nr:holo-ACP synthase [Arachnia sp.]